MSGRSVNLSLDLLSAHTCASNRQLPILNQRKEPILNQRKEKQKYVVGPGIMFEENQSIISYIIAQEPFGLGRAYRQTHRRQKVKYNTLPLLLLMYATRIIA